MGLVKGNYLDQSQTNLVKLGYVILKRRIICLTRTKTRKPTSEWDENIATPALQEKRVYLANAILKGLEGISLNEKIFLLAEIQGAKLTDSQRHKLLDIRTKIMGQLRELKIPLSVLKRSYG